jgi:nucleoside-triphosphatase THEP1
MRNFFSSEYTNSASSSSLPRIGQYNVFVDEFERIVLPLFTVRCFAEKDTFDCFFQ